MACFVCGDHVSPTDEAIDLVCSVKRCGASGVHHAACVKEKYGSMSKRDRKAHKVSSDRTYAGPNSMCFKGFPCLCTGCRGNVKKSSFSKGARDEPPPPPPKCKPTRAKLADAATARAVKPRTVRKAINGEVKLLFRRAPMPRDPEPPAEEPVPDAGLPERPWDDVQEAFVRGGVGRWDFALRRPMPLEPWSPFNTQLLYSPSQPSLAH